jgi:hypothetical protein
MAVIVYALNRHAERAAPKISQKGTEVFPASAHGYSAISITRVASASRMHADPNSVFRRVRFSVRTDGSFLTAATTLVFSRSKVTDERSARIAANASANKSSFFAPAWAV